MPSLHTIRDSTSTISVLAGSLYNTAAAPRPIGPARAPCRFFALLRSDAHDERAIQSRVPPAGSTQPGTRGHPPRAVGDRRDGDGALSARQCRRERVDRPNARRPRARAPRANPGEVGCRWRGGSCHQVHSRLHELSGVAFHRSRARRVASGERSRVAAGGDDDSHAADARGADGCAAGRAAAGLEFARGCVYRCAGAHCAAAVPTGGSR